MSDAVNYSFRNYCTSHKGVHARGCGNEILPFESAILSPWIEVEIFSKDAVITVGNKSSREFHHTASISGFKYQFSNGTSCEIEIIDEQGGAFTHVFQKAILKCANNVSEMYKIRVRFGWTGSSMHGGADRSVNIGATPRETIPWTLHYLLVKVDVQYGMGKIKYTAHCIDLMQVSETVRGRRVYHMTLKNAIRRFAREIEPRFDVQFLRRTENGEKTEEFDFEEGSDDKVREAYDMLESDLWGAHEPAGEPGEGPVKSYRCDNEDKFLVIERWLGNVLTDNGRGTNLQWDPFSENPTLIVWENAYPDCLEDLDCERNVGTFLVNAGKCSNVVSFSPRINWLATFSQRSVGGTAGGTVSSKPTEASNAHKCGGRETPETHGEEVGASDIQPNPDGDDIIRDGKDAAKKQAERSSQNDKANALYEIYEPIEADLTIIGQPNRPFVDPKNLIMRTCSIVVLNPLSVESRGSLMGPGAHNTDARVSGYNIDWIAQPYINEILTNRNWIIKGVSHDIRNGKYTTTLSVVLPYPKNPEESTVRMGGDPEGYEIETCIVEEGD